MSFVRGITGHWVRLLIVVVVVAIAAVAAVAALAALDTGDTPASPDSRVFTSPVIASSTSPGSQVLFQGVNRSGTEYACVQGWGIFDGPNNAGFGPGDRQLARQYRSRPD